jgi:Protein of unknown function (DUF3313)
MNKKDLLGLLSCFVVLAASPALLAQEPPEVTHDGLTRVENAKADLAYSLPEADFSIYERFMILEPDVAFRKNWERDYNRNAASLSDRVSTRDMDRIKTGMAELFLEVFTDELEKAGYSVVEEPGDDVLLLRPAIVNLDVAAPDRRSPSRTTSYVTSVGSATLYIEAYDSVSGQILARAADSKRARDSGTFQWASSTSNRAEARNVLRAWAQMLIASLDGVRESADP